jgi:hypothetical protein
LIVRSPRTKLAGFRDTDGFGVGVAEGVSIVVDGGVTGVKGMLEIVGDSVIGAADGLTQLIVNNVNKSRSISARSLVLNIPSISYPRVMIFHSHYGANS